MQHNKSIKSYKTIKSLLGIYSIIFFVCIFLLKDTFFWLGIGLCAMLFMHIKSLKKWSQIVFDYSKNELKFIRVNKKEKTYPIDAIYYAKSWDYEPIEIALYHKKSGSYLLILKVRSDEWEGFEDFYKALEQQTSEIDKNDPNIFREQVKDFAKEMMTD